MNRQSRSYQRVWKQELELHTLGGDLRPWRPIPARGIFWLAALEALMFMASHLPGSRQLLGAVGWEVTYLIVPLLLAWLFATAKVEGRRFHVTFKAWIGQVFLGKHLAGTYRHLEREQWKPKPVRLVRVKGGS